MLHIIREIITNILKHAMARKISILIYHDIAGLILQVKDNGKGFDIKKKNMGIGMNIITERAAAIKGVVEIESNNNGSKTTVTIPVAAMPADT